MVWLNRKHGMLAAIAAGALILGVAPVSAQTPPPDATPTPGTIAVPPTPPTASTLSATGVATAPGIDTQSGMLSMSVQERSTGKDAQGAVKLVQERIAKLKAALVAAGVPAANIQESGFNIGPYYGGGYPVPMPAIDPARSSVPPDGTPPPKKPMAEPAGPVGAGGAGVSPAIYPPVPPTITGFMVNANLEVRTSGPEQLGTAMRVAVDNGATGVNSYGKGGPGTPPDASVLAPAIAKATTEAQAVAKASANAGGVTLGTVRSINVLTPQPWYNGGPTAPQWQVQVQVTYNLR